MSCDVGHRCGLDLALMWLWCRLAAVVPMRPLAWELPYAEGAALKTNKLTNKKKPQNLLETIKPLTRVQYTDPLSAHLGTAGIPQCALTWRWGWGRRLSLCLVWRQEDGQNALSKSFQGFNCLAQPRYDLVRP